MLSLEAMSVDGCLVCFFVCTVWSRVCVQVGMWCVSIREFAYIQANQKVLHPIMDANALCIYSTIHQFIVIAESNPHLHGHNLNVRSVYILLTICTSSHVCSAAAILTISTSGGEY